MKWIALLLVIILFAVVIKVIFFSFRAQNPSDYAGTTPEFSMTTHLSGELLSEGLIYGPTGEVSNRFTARMVGAWNGDTGTLSEVFTYADGREQTRKWFITLGDDNRFSATADDIVGQASGVISGATVKMDYTIILPQEVGGHHLRVTDWLYMTKSGVILNRSELRKFGFKVAELVATIRPAKSGNE